MGASESTSRPNGTEEEEQQQNNGSSGGGRGSSGGGSGSSGGGSSRFPGAFAAIATVAVGAAAVVVGSRMIDTNEERNRGVMEPPLRNPSGWSPPRNGLLKMNTDGGCDLINRDRGPGWYGGILRNHRGEWVGGFRGFISESDTLASELVGILKGLEFLDKYNIKEAILETDSQPAFQLVKDDSDYRGKSPFVNASLSIIEQCRDLAIKTGVTFKLVSREANKCADKLAKMAIATKPKYEEIKDLPNDLMGLVERDAKSEGYF